MDARLYVKLHIAKQSSLNLLHKFSLIFPLSRTIKDVTKLHVVEDQKSAIMFDLVLPLVLLQLGHVAKPGGQLGKSEFPSWMVVATEPGITEPWT